jgi:Bax protein
LGRLAEQAKVAAVDEQFIADMSKLCRLKAMPTHRDTLRELLVKVGPIPPSLALAQAAIESGWGSSRFSQQGNNLYGQRVWSKKAGGIVAKDANDAHFRLAFPPTIAASVRSHMHNLNSHPAYQTLRKEQALLRRQGEAITGEALAGALWPIRHAGGLNTEYVSGITRFGTPCFLGPS